MSQCKIVIIGAAGRMGRTLIRLIAENDMLTLHAAVEGAGSPFLGQEAFTLANSSAKSSVLISADVPAALKGADVAIDFTIAKATMALLPQLVAAKVPYIIGTTGFSGAEEAEIHAASAHIPVLCSGNFSLGVNVLAALVQKAAATLDEDFDIEIVETHHNKKVDAPSGTAMLLGEAAASGRAIALREKMESGRNGHTGARARGAIGFAALRGGTVIGEHSVGFFGPSERIILSHSAEDRALFARGALKAATWIKDKAPKAYSMADVLDLR